LKISPHNLTSLKEVDFYERKESGASYSNDFDGKMSTPRQENSIQQRVYNDNSI